MQFKQLYYLLEQGRQRTALMIAAQEGHDKYVNTLVLHGADVNLVDRVGCLQSL